MMSSETIITIHIEEQCNLLNKQKLLECYDQTPYILLAKESNLLNFITSVKIIKVHYYAKRVYVNITNIIIIYCVNPYGFQASA